MSWKKGATQSRADRAIATTDATDFDKGLNEVIIEIEGEKDMKLKLKLIEDPKVIRSASIAKYEVDPNQDGRYKNKPKLGIPVKFLKTNDTDVVTISTKPQSDKTPDHIQISSSFSDLTVANIKLAEHNRVEYELSTSISNKYEIPKVFSCNDHIHFVTSAPEKSYDIEVYRLLEKDDDMPNYCHNKIEDQWSFDGPDDFDISLQVNCKDSIISENHVCILPGEDGGIDLGEALFRYMETDSNGNDLDKVIDILPNDKVKVDQRTLGAGENLKCDTRPFRSGKTGKYDFNKVDIEPGSSISESDIISGFDDIKEFYSRIGININLIWKGDLALNFDNKQDNNSIEYNKQTNLEFGILTKQLFGINASTQKIIKPENPVVYLVEDINPESTKGAALNGSNVCIIRDQSNWEITFAHELGHAIWDLKHPEDEFGITDGNNFMTEDLKNLNSNDITKLRSKWYQWIRIH